MPEHYGDGVPSEESEERSPEAQRDETLLEISRLRMEMEEGLLQLGQEIERTNVELTEALQSKDPDSLQAIRDHLTQLAEYRTKVQALLTRLAEQEERLKGLGEG